MKKEMNLKDLDFNFPSNNNGEIRGISDPGIESFSGAPIKGLGREILQNSLDANKMNIDPAIVEFQLFYIPFQELPGNDSLKDSFNRGLDFFSTQKSEKARNFYLNGLNLMDKQIPILRISDFNTTGLTGSRGSYNTPWLDLTKASGVSDKAVGSMGSFGIGKFASFAASSFRTIFYNTVDIEGNHAFQGISRITSFKREDGETTQGVGYLGNENNTPLYENRSIDPNYEREISKTGTDIYIAGFRNIENTWEESIISAVIDDFLYAIYIGNLVVKIGAIEINKDNLNTIMEEFHEFFSEGAKDYYKVLTDENTSYSEINYRNDGLIKFWLLLDEHLINKTSFYRGAGMKIKDRPFNNPLVNGAALLMIEGERIQNNIVPLENPQHTNWEPQRADNTPWARNYINGIYDIVKDKLSEITNSGDSVEIDSDVGEFLPLISDENESEAKEEIISDEIKTTEKRKVLKKVNNIQQPIQPVKNSTFSEEIDSEIEDEILGNFGHKQSNNPIKDSDTLNDNGPGEGYGDGSYKKKLIHQIQILNLRVIVLDKDEGKYSISFIPDSNLSNVKISVSLVGESINMNIKILEAFMPHNNKNLQINNNKITGLSVYEDQLVRLIIKIDFHDYAALEVRVHGN